MTKRDDDQDYEVGYGRPPRHTRFPKGQSGNPRGRPPRSKNVGSIIRETLLKPVQGTLDGKTVWMPAFEAVLLGQMKEAMAGDKRSVTTVLKIATQHRDMETNDTAVGEAGEADPSVSLEEVDIDVLQHFADLVREGSWTPEREGDGS